MIMSDPGPAELPLIHLKLSLGNMERIQNQAKVVYQQVPSFGPEVLHSLTSSSGNTFSVLRMLPTVCSYIVVPRYKYLPTCSSMCLRDAS